MTRSLAACVEIEQHHSFVLITNLVLRLLGSRDFSELFVIRCSNHPFPPSIRATHADMLVLKLELQHLRSFVDPCFSSTRPTRSVGRVPHFRPAQYAESGL